MTNGIRWENTDSGRRIKTLQHSDGNERASLVTKQIPVNICRFWRLILPALLAILNCKGAEEGTRLATLDPKSVYYNSRDSFCKSPFGAVPAGTEITMRFLAKEGSLQSVTLQVVKTTMSGNNEKTEYANFVNFPMQKKGVTNGQDIFKAWLPLSSSYFMPPRRTSLTSARRTTNSLL